MNIGGQTLEQQLAVDNFRKFAQAKIKPLSREHGDRFIPKEEMREIVRSLSEYGLPGAAIPLDLGGLGLGYVMHGLLVEELAAASADVCTSLLLNTLTADMLVGAPEHLRKRYLPGLLAGELFGCLGISEPDVGSNVADIKTRAVRDGDDYVITGEKTWITNGHYSDFIICAVRTGPHEISHILVDREGHGYESRNIEKMALNAQSTAQVFFSGVRVPATNLIGGAGDGLRNTMRAFEKARCHVGLISVGLMRAALDETIAYATARKQFGKVLASHQLVAAKIAEMATLTDAARLLCYRALGLIDAGVRCDLQASMAKWYSNETAVRVCRDAVQLHGANGLTKEFSVERLAREAIIFPIPDGTTEIQKLIIARGLTGISALV